MQIMVGISREWTAAAFREHERHVWAIAYRMTGSAADADDVVQETFARALERPPERLDAPLRPWLTRVAVNVARDALRRRKRRRYVGPWLPTPVETGSDGPGPGPGADAGAGAGASVSAGAGAGMDADTGTDAGANAESRYGLRESASFAFLLALEALTPQQRAVLLLRDVLDYSVREAADALALSEGNVKTTHHRARRAMAAYDRTRRPPSAQLAAATRDALQRFLLALVQQDAAALEACLADGARALTDGGGEYLAALRPVHGRDRVARFLVGLQRKADWKGQFALRDINGLPALVAELDTAHTRWAPRAVLRLELDARDAIREVHLVVASTKLVAVAAAGTVAARSSSRAPGSSGRMSIDALATETGSST
jgi:RNA polymerase sigma-70 factor (ECF subfamily)